MCCSSTLTTWTKSGVNRWRTPLPSTAKQACQQSTRRLARLSSSTLPWITFLQTGADRFVFSYQSGLLSSRSAKRCVRHVRNVSYPSTTLQRSKGHVLQWCPAYPVCTLSASNIHLTSSRQPIVTGTSVLAIKFKDGIMMAADNLGIYSYCPPFRFPNTPSCSLIRLTRTFQGHPASPQGRRLHRHRRRRGHVRLSVHPIHPR